MKQTITCGRCKAKIDIDEGTVIAVCYASVTKAPSSGHGIAVDAKSPAGVQILDHIEQKPQPHRGN